MRLATRVHVLCISQSFLTPTVTDYRVMASLSCTHLLFLVHASAGNKAELDLTDVYIHHFGITKKTVEQHNLQEKSRCFTLGSKCLLSRIYLDHKFYTLPGRSA